MRPVVAALFGLLVACGAPTQPEPEPADFSVTLHSNRSENWTDYICTAAIRLAPPSGDAGVSDTVTVAAGKDAEVTLTVDRPGTYTLGASLTWKGTAPGTSWYLASGPWGDTLMVDAPGSHRLECP